MPLQFALANGHLEAAELLIERGTVKGTVVDVAVQVAVTRFLGCNLV